MSLSGRDETLKHARRNLVRYRQEQEAHFLLTLPPLTGASLPHRYVFGPLISYVAALANVLVVCANGKGLSGCDARGSGLWGERERFRYKSLKQQKSSSAPTAFGAVRSSDGRFPAEFLDSLPNSRCAPQIRLFQTRAFHSTEFHSSQSRTIRDRSSVAPEAM